jgi:hypothetical protein
MSDFVREKNDWNKNEKRKEVVHEWDLPSKIASPDSATRLQSEVNTKRY